MRSTIFVLLFISAVTVSAQKLQRVTAEKVGMDSRRLSLVDNVFRDALKEKRMPGAVLGVVRHGKMAYLKAYGNRRIVPFQEKMTESSIFDMASCSKPVSTASCVMKLVEQGRVRLLDPVSQYIPGFQNWKSEDGKEEVIRVHHLLTHSSGLPAYASVDYLKKTYPETSPEALMDHIAHCTRNSRPGSRFRYSCLNFITLQHIVENVSGQSLRDFARNQIFAPLGMNHTDYLPCRENEKNEWECVSLPCWVNETDRERTSINSQNFSEIMNKALEEVAPTEIQKSTGQVLCGQVHDPLARVMNHGISGNAGLFTTVDDLAIFCAMMQNGGEWNGVRVFSPLTVRALRTVPVEEASLGRTLGWDLHTGYSSNKGDLLSPSTYCHTGYTGTSIVIDPENDVSIILLINAVHPEDNTSTSRLKSQVSNIVAASIIK